MLIGIAGVILAFVFTYKAYETANRKHSSNKNLISQLFYALLSLGVAIVVTLIGLLFHLIYPQSTIVLLMTIIVAVTLITALIFLWFSYLNSLGIGDINTEILIAAIFLSISFLSPVIGRGGLNSVPVLGETVNISATVFPNVNIERDAPLPSISQTIASGLESLKPKKK